MVNRTNAKDEKGRYTTKNPKNKTMRVTEEEYYLIMKRRRENGENADRVLINEYKADSLRIKNSCHICGQSDHKNNITVGFDCLKDLLTSNTSQNDNYGFVECSLCNDLVSEAEMQTHIKEFGIDEGNRIRQGWKHQNYVRGHMEEFNLTEEERRAILS